MICHSDECASNQFAIFIVSLFCFLSFSAMCSSEELFLHFKLARSVFFCIDNNNLSRCILIWFEKLVAFTFDKMHIYILCDSRWSWKISPSTFINLSFIGMLRTKNFMNNINLLIIYITCSWRGQLRLDLANKFHKTF